MENGNMENRQKQNGKMEKRFKGTITYVLFSPMYRMVKDDLSE